MLILLLAILPLFGPVRDTVDVAEVNHFYDEQGRLVFDQLILWDWDGKRHQVVAWRLIKCRRMLPMRGDRGYAMTFLDGETMRRVEAKSARETWTQYDPELWERGELPKEARRELTGGTK